MRVIKYGIRYALIICVVTAGIGVIALTDRNPHILGIILFPGGVIAWTAHGDNYASDAEFLKYTVIYGASFNSFLAFMLGALVAVFTRRSDK